MSSFRDRLRGGDVSLGSWITLAQPAIAEILARAGFEWLVVDLEHSVISLGEAGALIRTIDLCGVAPLVRVTSNDPNQIKRIMDAGAHGIVVPMVNTDEEARRAVAATRYPPAGNRGVGLARAQGYGASFREYFEWQTSGPVVIVQIEHRDALANLDAILSVDGVDGFLIGPYDLSASMGIPGQFDNPEFREALASIRAAGTRAHRAAGIHVVEPDRDRLSQAIADGFTLIPYSVDIRMLDVMARAGVNAVPRVDA